MDFPTGVSFHTGANARTRRRLEERQTALLAERGFEEVITPVLDFFDGLSGRGHEEWIYKFPDQLTGRTLALRWDFTLQIARLAARLGGAGTVHRWCYRGNVFRAIEEHAGQKRQIYQVGAELMGDPSHDSTVGMIRLAVELLRESGLTSFSLVVGHVAFVERLFRLTGLPADCEGRFLEVLRRKDLSGLAALAAEFRVPGDHVEAVRRSMYLVGGGETLDTAERLLGGELAGGPIGELRALLEGAGPAREHVIFDLTEPRGFDYYTGVMFQAVVPRIGREVCRGGRYDNLLERFGWPAPAVGFAVDLDLVHQALESQTQRRSE